MVITLIKNSRELILCDGAARGVNVSSGPTGMVYAGQAQRQVGMFLRSTSARVYPRGNALDQFSFSVTRELSSMEEAYAWLFEHRLQLPRDDDPEDQLYCEFRHGSGATYRLLHADCNIVAARFAGVTITLEYDIVGAPLTSGRVGSTE